MAQALELNDKDHDAWTEFAELFIKQRKARSAINSLKKQSKLIQLMRFFLAKMGKIAKTTKEPKSPIKFYSQTIKLDEMNLELFKSRRESYKKLGRSDLADKMPRPFMSYKIMLKELQSQVPNCPMMKLMKMINFIK